MTRDHIDSAVTAKLVRAILRESFPGVTFSVRTARYAGGSSIDIAWLDGPTEVQVRATAGTLSGAYFDGMLDYQGSNYHTLDGVPVRFGADYIHGHREYTRAAVDAAIMHLFATREELRCQPYPDVLVNEKGCAHIAYGDPLSRVMIGRDWGTGLVWRTCAETSHCDTQPSPTLARVAFTHDDGYSRGVSTHAI